MNPNQQTDQCFQMGSTKQAYDHYYSYDGKLIGYTVVYLDERND